jgi:hypothetical protein
MDGVFSEIGIPAWDFVQVSAMFLLTMLLIFGPKNRTFQWLSYFMLAIFALQCLLFIAFRDGLRVKLFGALMLTSALLIVAVTKGKRGVRSDTTVK